MQKIINYIKNFIDEILGKGGKRSNALVLLISCIVFSVSLIMLICKTKSEEKSRSLAAEIGIVTSALAGLSGYTYRQGKLLEHKESENKIDK